MKKMLVLFLLTGLMLTVNVFAGEVERFVDEKGMTHFVGQKTPREKEEENRRREAEVDLILSRMITRAMSMVSEVPEIVETNRNSTVRRLIRLPPEQLQEEFRKKGYRTDTVLRYFHFFTPEQQAAIRAVIRETVIREEIKETL